jgi:hypothetical protein
LRPIAEVIPSEARDLQFDDLQFSHLQRQSSDRSLQVGLMDAISAMRFALVHALIRFSARMASIGLPNVVQ